MSLPAEGYSLECRPTWGRMILRPEVQEPVLRLQENTLIVLARDDIKQRAEVAKLTGVRIRSLRSYAGDGHDLWGREDNEILLSDDSPLCFAWNVGTL